MTPSTARLLVDEERRAVATGVGDDSAASNFATGAETRGGCAGDDDASDGDDDGEAGAGEACDSRGTEALGATSERSIAIAIE